MKFSRRVSTDAPNDVTLAIREATRGGRPPANLSDSNPTRHGLGAPALPNPWASDPRGPLASREILADFLARSQGRAVDPANLYLISSTSQGYAWLMKLLADPGDAVLSPTPGYPLVSSLAALEGVEEIPYPLHFDGRWYLDTAEIERILTTEGDRVRAIILINPNNPTGSYVSAEDRAAVIELARHFGVALIADEVFFDFRLDAVGSIGPHDDPANGSAAAPAKPTAAPTPTAGPARPAGPRELRLAGLPDTLTFSLDGLSKKLGAPQAKVGWIEVSGPDADVREALRRLDVIADSYLPYSTLTDQVLADLLAGVPAQTDRIAGRTARNLAALTAAVAADPTGLTSALPPEAGWNALVRFPATIDEDALVARLIRERGLSLQPGYFFDMPSDGYVSLSLLLEPERFDEGVGVLLETVADMAG